MTPYEIISVAVSVTALLAVAASLWLLQRQVKVMAHQTEQLSRTLEMSAESAIDTLFMLVSQAYLDHPVLRRIFNEGEPDGVVEPHSSDTLLRASALSETILDAMERSLIFEERGLPESAAALRAWIEDSFRHSTFLRAWLDDHRSWYAPRLTAILDHVESERLARSGGEPPDRGEVG